MKKNIAFPMLALACANVSAATPESEPQKEKLPNIICITCEDISPMIGCFGDKVAVTPNLDKFSERAIRYTNMHSNVGVSSPSRYALITGRYPMADGANYMRTISAPHQKPKGIKPYSVIVDPSVKCYTEYLRAAGYYCTNNEKTDYQFELPATAWDECGKDAHWKHRPEGMPFFSIFNLFVTHESQSWVRAEKPFSVDPKDIVVPPYYPDTKTVRHDMAVTYSNITEMDRQFQKLYDELEAAGELENTIVIWYSDNGGPLPHHKREIYDRGTLVPFMISFPDKYKAGVATDQIVQFVDIPATILSLVGIETPEYMHGIPFLGKYATQSPRQYAFGGRDRMDECIDKQGYIRDHRYRYVRNYYPGQTQYLNVAYRLNLPMMNELLDLHKQGKLNKDQDRFFSLPRPAEEFYDLEKDPYELHNVIDDKDYAAEIERMRKDYDNWIQTQTPDWLIPEIDNIKRILPDGKQPVVAQPFVRIEKNKVTLNSLTPGASINYRIVSPKGETSRWMIYHEPFAIEAGSAVETVAARIGYADSQLKRVNL